MQQNRFNEKAHSYEKYASLQRQVATDMLIFLRGNLQAEDRLQICPTRKIIDIGCGTGFLAEAMQEIAVKSNNKHSINQSVASPINYPVSVNNLHITGVDSSAMMCWVARRKALYQQVVLADVSKNMRAYFTDKFDMAISSMMMQWQAHQGLTILATSFVNIADIIKQGGYFAFSAPVFGSMAEVKELFLQYEGEDATKRFLNFLEAKEYITQLARANFCIMEYQEKSYNFQAESLKELLRNINKIGASFNEFRPILPSAYKNMVAKPIPNLNWKIGFFICKHQ